jgi:hypothetical protein
MAMLTKEFEIPDQAPDSGVGARTVPETPRLDISDKFSDNLRQRRLWHLPFQLTDAKQKQGWIVFEGTGRASSVAL